MSTARSRPDDVQPIKIRVRRVFSGSGETETCETVHCPGLDRSLPLGSCDVCGRKQGELRGLGEPSVLCDHSKAQGQVLRQILHARAVTPDSTPVCDVMTTHVFCVRPDVSLDALLGFLLERNISSVPVVDERGAPIGMVSKTDVVRHRYEDDGAACSDDHLERGFHGCTLAQSTVADLMSPVPIIFGETTPISQVAAAMAYERVHQLPIVGLDGTVVGIVSSLDVVRWYAEREGHVGVRRS